jgi:hypothetical protein
MEPSGENTTENLPGVLVPEGSNHLYSVYRNAVNMIGIEIRRVR